MCSSFGIVDKYSNYLVRSCFEYMNKVYGIEYGRVN